MKRIRIVYTNIISVNQEFSLFSDQSKKRQSSPSYIYGRCILLADYLVYRNVVMDGSKRGYMRTSVLAADSCRPRGDFVSCKNFSLSLSLFHSLSLVLMSQYEKAIEFHAGMILHFCSFSYSRSYYIHTFVLLNVIMSYKESQEIR